MEWDSVHVNGIEQGALETNNIVRGKQKRAHYSGKRKCKILKISDKSTNTPTSGPTNPNTPTPSLSQIQSPLAAAQGRKRTVGTIGSRALRLSVWQDRLRRHMTPFVTSVDTSMCSRSARCTAAPVRMRGTWLSVLHARRMITRIAFFT